MTKLFEPYRVADLTLKNRFIVAPMCQYSARQGVPNDWHLVHLGRFALGGFSLVIAEASAVAPEGRITYADTGIWSDEQAHAWRRVVEFLLAHRLLGAQRLQARGIAPRLVQARFGGGDVGLRARKGGLIAGPLLGGDHVGNDRLGERNQAASTQ